MKLQSIKKTLAAVCSTNEAPKGTRGILLSKRSFRLMSAHHKKTKSSRKISQNSNDGSTCAKNSITHTESSSKNLSPQDNGRGQARRSDFKESQFSPDRSVVLLNNKRI